MASKYWRLGDFALALATPEEFDRMPDGTRLMTINGEMVIKGQDEIDRDTRSGYMAYGHVVQLGAKCETCGKPLPSSEVAASVTLAAPPQDLSWCFDCWDHDERAVLQYRNAGSHVRT